MNDWICNECNYRGTEHLSAPHPFDDTQDVIGCPKCRAIDSLFEACDEPGCVERSTCGYPTPNGYRRTCGGHYKRERTK